MNETDGPFSRLGLALQVVRHFSGLSQASLAHKAGMGKSQLSKYENAVELPKLSSLGRLLGALGMSPSAFFKVVGVLDTLHSDNAHTGEAVWPLAAEFQPLLSKEEQGRVLSVISEVLKLYEAQIEFRVRAGLQGALTESAGRRTPKYETEIRQ